MHRRKQVFQYGTARSRLTFRKGGVDVQTVRVEEERMARDDPHNPATATTNPTATPNSASVSASCSNDTYRDSSPVSDVTEIIPHFHGGGECQGQHVIGDDNFKREPKSEPLLRQCISCLIDKTKTEDVFEDGHLRPEIEMLLSHLGAPIRGNESNTGLCLDCMEQLQRWHAFYTTRRKHLDLNPPPPVKDEYLPPKDEKDIDSIEGPFQIDRYPGKKLAEFKDICDKSEFLYYAERDWDQQDLEFICYQLCQIQSLSSPEVKDLELYFTDKKKLLRLFCGYCMDFVPGGKEGFTSHMAENHNQDPVFFPCDICGESFPNKEFAIVDDYFTHWLQHFYFFRCDLCDISLPTMSMLLQHNTVWHKKVITKYEHQSQPKVIPCEHSLTSDLVNSEVGDEGGSSTSQSSAVRKTVKYKKKKTGLPYVVCQICGERVQRAVALSHYIKHKKDGEIDEQQLAFCIKVENLSKESIKVAAFFSGTTEANSAKNVAESKTTIANHFQKSKVSRVRNQLPRYKCRFCPRKFFRADWLHQHEKFVHLNVRNYDCAICLKSFMNYWTLIAHERSHMNLGYPIYECTMCSREFLSELSLNSHNCKGAPKKVQIYKCETCNKIFKTTRSYTNHLTNHHTNVRNYKCKICGSKFRLYSQLKNHSKRCRQLPVVQVNGQEIPAGLNNTNNNEIIDISDSNDNTYLDMNHAFVSSSLPTPAGQCNYNDPVLTSPAITMTSDEEDPFSLTGRLWE